MAFADLILRLPVLALFLACLYGAHHSETSYTWRLDMDMGKVMPAAYFPQPPPPPSGSGGKEEDPLKIQEAVLDILMSTVTNTDGTWKKTSRESACFQCERPPGLVTRNNRGGIVRKADEETISEEDDDEQLDCGKPVNFTYYDHLVGIQNRHTHPNWSEPEVALTFKTKKSASSKKATSDINIETIERRLKKAKREKPKSVELYNQIGNFWRVKGDCRLSIECFRRALAVSPNNAEILLNLARVLFNLQYLDDAIFLTRRSLEVQPPDQNAWQQHFQLGEILKAYCHYQEAALHLRHVLELKPNYAPAVAALQDMESLPDSSVHVYTVIIIVLLVMGVLLWIASTLDVTSGGGGGGEDASDNGGSRAKLPFNAARMRFHMRHKRFL